MTTANAHSLTHRGTLRAAKSVIAKVAMPAVKVRCVAMIVALIGWLKQIRRNHRSRQELAKLDTRLLADIGISEAQRQSELHKPFWKTERLG